MNTKTVTGKLVYKFADLFLVQWEDMLKLYPKAKYFGSLFQEGVMIFVTLGTQDKPFTRLLEMIQKQIDNGNIKEKVVVQAGYTKFESDDMKIFDYVDGDDFNNLIEEADILITHGGVGSIFTGLRAGKRIIAVPRLAKYGEHTNDHQIQIVSNFDSKGYLIKVNSDEEMEDAIKRVKNLNLISGNLIMINLLKDQKNIQIIINFCFLNSDML